MLSFHSNKYESIFFLFFSIFITLSFIFIFYLIFREKSILCTWFGVFCVYEYACDNRGQFIKSDIIDLGGGKYRATTGRKAVFYNKAIKTDNPLHFTYQHNLQTVSRTLDSSELYTKLYVSPIESNTMDTGYVNIADADSNPLMDEFSLNFDYLYSIGSGNDF